MLQVQLVRAHQELKAVQQLKLDSGAFAVALPGAQGRALQARSNDAKRNDRLIKRVSALMVQLQLEFPLDTSTEQYTTALKLLRDQEVQRLQQQVEAEVSALAGLKLDRQQLGSASKLTRLLTQRAARKSNRVRELVTTMRSWQQAANIPRSSVVDQLPTWSENDIKQLFKGEFPWRTTGGGVLTALAERYRDACAEVRVQVDMSRLT
jgi:multidrug efflux pump subunit AcrA (membrane-fusion protein)